MGIDPISAIANDPISAMSNLVTLGDAAIRFIQWIKKYCNENKKTKCINEQIQAYQQTFDWGTFIKCNKEKLNSYIKAILFEDITACLLLFDEKSREQLRKKVLHRALEEASANSVSEQRQVAKYLDEIILIVGNNLRTQKDNATQLSFNHVVDELSNIIKQSTTTTLSELQTMSQSITEQMNTVINTIQYKDSFAEVIDNIPPLPSSNAPFHYRNSNMGFYGREKEFATLDKFLDDDAPLLFKIITGSSGAGKSKLLYEYTNVMMGNSIWKTVFFHDDDMKRAASCTTHTYNDNLLVVIDYAGKDVTTLGPWLGSLCRQYQSQNGPKFKLRIVLLERAGIIKETENNTENSLHENMFEKYPYWYDRLLSSTHFREDIKRLISFSELNPLTTDDLGLMLDKYAKSKSRSFTKDQKTRILSYCASIEKSEKVIRPLIALFVADAWLDDTTYNHWNLEQLLKNVNSQKNYTCIDI
jgi:hypothetical protein